MRMCEHGNFFVGSQVWTWSETLILYTVQLVNQVGIFSSHDSAIFFRLLTSSSNEPEMLEYM